MRLYLLALNPTDSVTQGFLPAAARLGLDVTVLTDHAEPHRRAYAALASAPDVVECDVRDFREVIGLISRRDAPDAVFSNSDHLQTQTALAAEYFGLAAKDWKATLRAKNKGELRRHLAAAGLDAVRSFELDPGQDPAVLREFAIPFPVVVKPREGVASEDVSLVADAEELERRCTQIQHRRPGAALVVEEFLDGQLCTLETLGDAKRRHVLGGFRTRLSPPRTSSRRCWSSSPPTRGRWSSRSSPSSTPWASGSAPATPSSSCSRTAGPGSSRSTTVPSATSAT